MSTSPIEEKLRTNQLAWNEWARLHVGSKSYDVEGFKAGQSSLLAIEREEIGDVGGKSLLHLQCHFGLDSLSWARAGARVTGVDFSDDAIGIARSLNDELGLDANFVCSNLYDLRNNLTGQFDIVYTSYGVLCWLPDLRGWAEVIEHFTKSGGIFYVVEDHPAALIFDNDEKAQELRMSRSYFYDPAGDRYDEPGSYAEPDAKTVHNVKYEWKHSLGDIINALIGTGLRVESLHEFPYSFYPLFWGMEKGDDGWWRMPTLKYDIPFMFSLMARKP